MKGMALFQTLMLLVLLLLVVSALLQWTYGRYIVSKKTVERVYGQGAAEGVYAQVLACLEGTTVGQANCIVPAPVQSCFPTEAEITPGMTLPVTVTVTGSAPNCEVRIGVSLP